MKKTKKITKKPQKKVKSAPKKPTKAVYAAKKPASGKNATKSKNRRVIVINVR